MSFIESGGGGYGENSDPTFGDVVATGTLDASRITVDGGTEGAPGLTFAENPDSGIWHAGTANSSMHFAIDGNTGLSFNRNGGDYRLQSPVGAHLLGFSRFVTNLTAASTNLNQTFNPFQVFTNIGATETITVNLPSAPTYGMTYTIKRCASFAIQVNPGANDAIRYSGGLMADGEYLELASDGAYVELVADSEGNWNTIAEGGTLTEESP